MRRGKPQTKPGAVRIISGRWRGRLIPVADLPGLRPTPDRVRETVFNWIANALGDLQRRSVLDLFAGSGILGFEAASRGARSVVLVELQTTAIRNLRHVCELFEARQIEVRAGDALTIVAQLLASSATFDLIFIDPPFASSLVKDTLPLAAQLCTPDGLIYVESGSAIDGALADAIGLEPYRSDKAGEVFYHLLQRKKED